MFIILLIILTLSFFHSLLLIILCLVRILIGVAQPKDFGWLFTPFSRSIHVVFT